ncbi:hypothetical protein AB0H73_08050 [Streptomyces olivoreticuli]
MQAGRLEIPVVAALDGFGRELRTKVETAAKGLKIKIPVRIDDKGLRKRLERAVKEASAGVSAKVKVKTTVDRSKLRRELDEAVRHASAGDGIRVPVRTDGDGEGRRGGGLLSRLRGLLGEAQGEADRNPVRVPVQMQEPRGRHGGGRRMLRTLALGSLVSVVAPALGALTQYGIALTALISAASPAVGVLGAVPGLIAAAGTAAIGTRIAFGGFGEALKATFKEQKQLASGTKITKAQQQQLAQAMGDVSSSAKKTVLSIAEVSDSWKDMRKGVQERFFSKIADQVEPLSKAVLPLLSSSLGDASSQMGSLARRGAKFMQSGVFASDFRTIAKTNSALIGNLSGSVRNLGHATMDFLVASGPFTRRVGNATERMTRWMRASTAAGRETNSLAKFLDHAGDKAAQLGRTTKYLGKGLAAVGRAGMDSGNALLDGLEGTMVRFNRWARSEKGQTGMKQFFSDAAPTFHELNMLVGDFFRGLGRMAQSNGITQLVRQIRTELMPGVGKFFDSIGQSIGPAVISLIANLATAFSSLSSAGSGLGVLLTSFNGLLSLLNQLMRTVPGLGTALGTLLGAFMAFRMLSSIVSVLGRFGTSMRSVVTSSAGATAAIGPQIGTWQRLRLAASSGATAITGAMRGAGAAASSIGTSMRNVVSSSSGVTGAIGPQISAWNRMQVAYRGAAQGAGSLSGALRSAGTAIRGAGFGVGSLVSALGGPLGAALTAASVGLGLWASNQERAARATQAHQERVNSLAQALRDSNGAIDANVRAQTAQLLQDTKLADGKGKLVDKMRAAGVSLKDLTDAYLGPTDSLKKLQEQLEATARAHSRIEKSGNRETQRMSLEYDETGRAAKNAAEALKGVRGELDESVAKNKELAEASKTAGGAGTDAFSRLRSAVNGLSSETASADERMTSLKRALDAITGNTESFHEAQTRLNAAILSVNDAIEQGGGKIENASKVLIGYDGQINTASKSGQEFNARMTELRNSALSAATAAFEMSKANGTPLAEALKTGQGEMEKARAAAVNYGTSLGLTEKEAGALADKMGLMPSTVSMLFKAEGMPTIYTELVGLQGELGKLKAGDNTVLVKAPTGEAMAALQALGYQVSVLPNKEVMIKAPTDEARGQLAMLLSAMAATPSNKQVTVSTMIGDAVSGLTSVRDSVVSLPEDRTVQVSAPSALAQEELRQLGFRIEEVPNSKDVRITAPSDSAIGSVQAIQGAINSLTGKTVDVTIRYNSVGKPYADTTEHANGGIVRFSQYTNGGIRRLGNRVKAFAQGSERHVAQIARAGEWRLWAEPETGGEAYLPLSRAKRRRSKAILDQVAREFGGQVVYPNDLNSAQAPSALYRNARTAAVARPSGAHVNTSLVGGDLNLTMTAAPMAPGAALQDAMFELRRIRHGGAHA